MGWKRLPCGGTAKRLERAGSSIDDCVGRRAHGRARRSQTSEEPTFHKKSSPKSWFWRSVGSLRGLEPNRGPEGGQGCRSRGRRKKFWEGSQSSCSRRCCNVGPKPEVQVGAPGGEVVASGAGWGERDPHILRGPRVVVEASVKFWQFGTPAREVRLVWP